MAERYLDFQIMVLVDSSLHGPLEGALVRVVRVGRAEPALQDVPRACAVAEVCQTQVGATFVPAGNIQIDPLLSYSWAYGVGLEAQQLCLGRQVMF